MEQKLKDILSEMQIHPNMKGYDLIIDAVSILQEAQGHVPTMQLYEMIAEKRNSSIGKVERNIRRCISMFQTYSSSNPEIMQKYFHRSDAGWRLTNSIFLYSLSNIVSNAMLI